MEVHIFPNGISTKVNAVTGLEVESNYDKIIDQDGTHYASRIL